MLTIIQIIAILQGIFLVFVLFQRRTAYQKTNFWLFIGCLISVILFALGDDDYNLVMNDTSWFFFHEPLIISFFFLFIRYNNVEQSAFKKLDALFFLPYLLYVFFESLSDINHFEDSLILKIGGNLIEFSFLGMLLYSIHDILKHQKEKWLLAFIIPFALIFLLDGISPLFLNAQASFLYTDSYGVFLIAILLFYFVTYRLITSPNHVLGSANNKYNSSNLSQLEIESSITELNRLMTEQQLFKNQKLSVNEVAAQLGITRQRLSEILNVHMGMRFQDFLNKHRVEEFIKCLHQERYKNYTLLGIATEVGFSSKSSFNSTFKKIKGMTPSQYKKSKM